MGWAVSCVYPPGVACRWWVIDGGATGLGSSVALARRLEIQSLRAFMAYVAIILAYAFTGQEGGFYSVV